MSKSLWPPSGRIPYLDGLRAFSIATVVLGHSKDFIPFFKTKAAIPVDAVADGRFGVRVFFVLSGFLITTLLLNEIEKTGRISITGFYERRIARIFPAFYTYLLTLLVLSMFHVIGMNWQDMVTAVTYTWNYGSLWGVPSGPTGEVLGHLWTISLEEQFYLFWPACLIFAGTRRARGVAIACVSIFPLLRIASYFLIPSTRGQLIMMFHTGADTILWGAIAAFACQGGALERMRDTKYRAAVPWLCALAVFVIRPILEFKIRGAAVIISPTLESICIVLFIFWLLSGEGGFLRRGLDSWPMVQLGLISYSLYLWQQLFTMCDKLYFLSLPVRLLCALTVAILSYRFIEIPLRTRIRKWFSQSQPAH